MYVMKNNVVYSNILGFIAFFVCAVTLTILAMKYEPNLVILPPLFFGLYTSRIVVNRIKKK